MFSRLRWGRSGLAVHAWADLGFSDGIPESVNWSVPSQYVWPFRLKAVRRPDSIRDTLGEVAMTRIPVLVRGVGDVGSAVAHRLFSDGYAVVIHDSPEPPATRRKMAFADAVFDGVALLDDVEAQRAMDVDMVKALMVGKTVAVFVGPFPDLLEAIKPDVLIDARMRKRMVPESQRGSAPLTIGLGPNFEAGA